MALDKKKVETKKKTLDGMPRTSEDKKKAIETAIAQIEKA